MIDAAIAITNALDEFIPLAMTRLRSFGYHRGAREPETVLTVGLANCFFKPFPTNEAGKPR
jgi:hypothetical protein